MKRKIMSFSIDILFNVPSIAEIGSQLKVRTATKTKNRYNQVPHLTRRLVKMGIEPGTFSIKMGLNFASNNSRNSHANCIFMILESPNMSSSFQMCAILHQSKPSTVSRPLDKSAYQKENFLISHPKHMLWVLKRTVSVRRFFRAPKTYAKNHG